MASTKLEKASKISNNVTKAFPTPRLTCMQTDRSQLRNLTKLKKITRKSHLYGTMGKIELLSIPTTCFGKERFTNLLKGHLL